MNVLLAGVVGSTAYGLDHEGSDVDLLGLYAVPTVELHGLYPPAEDSVVTTEPDVTLHEAAKWCRLAISCNPTATELVWLPDHLYTVSSQLGNELISTRSSFLSAERVRDAYLGYAHQQFKRLVDRGDGSFSADTRKRTAKHARHLRRLCHQGYSLYTTGHLPIRLDNPQEYMDFGEEVAENPDAATPVLSHYEWAFSHTRTVLPDRPDTAPAEAWLRRVRAHFYAGNPDTSRAPR
jgi:predicted nucleotidyltransferase